MTDTLKSLPVALVTDSYATAYTVPALTEFNVAMLHLCNTGDDDVTVDVCLVPDGGSAGVANSLLGAFTLAAHDVLEILKGDIWPADSTLQVKASIDEVVTLKLSGIESTT